MFCSNLLESAPPPAAAPLPRLRLVSVSVGSDQPFFAREQTGIRS
jgi:hypothetical protein